jgi:ribosomal subunit interface protein
MTAPLQLTFHGLEPSTGLDTYVRARAAKLDTFYDRITRCRVAVEAPHHRRRRGQQYRIRIDMRVPGEELVIDRAPDANTTREDAYAAIDAAFDEAGRRLEDYVRRRRTYTKVHEHHSRGRVVKHFAYEGYGFIETTDGESFYFHRNSVLNDAFERMKIGDEVAFVAEEGDQGPQASTVTLRQRQRRVRSA